MKKKSLVVWTQKNCFKIFSWNKKYNWSSYQINLPAFHKKPWGNNDIKIRVTIEELKQKGG